MMHIHAPKFYLNQQFTKTNLGLGTQENRFALDIDGFPSRKRLLRKKKRLENCGGKTKEDRTGQVFKETERKNEITKHFKSKEGGEKKVIKDVFKKKRWAFEYEIEKNLGIIPVNLI